VSDFETIFKYGTVGMAVIDTEGNFLRANPSFLQLLQSSEEELLSRNFSEVSHPEDLCKEIKLFTKLVSGEINSYTIEKRYKVKNSHAWALLTAARSEDGKHIINEIQDITRIKVIENDLRNFAYTASHDLQAPLRIINGYAYMIQSAVQTLPPTFGYYINNIVEAVNRMSEMMDGLLAYSRINRGDDYDNVNLLDAVCLAKKNLAEKIENTKAVVNIKGKANIAGIKGQLVQLFQNLLDNAIKYRCEERNPRIMINIKQTEKNTTISVSDNGIGIAEEDFDTIFQIFKQLQPQNKIEGRGVGLAIVKQIVEHHKGQINVKSTIGKGTTFCISIPSKIK
jgi:PAS domain S-box-containing protein